MILYTLQCGSEHRFDAWFRDGSTYEAQVAGGEVSCPVCADTAIEKAPMAPRIAKGASAPAAETPSTQAEAGTKAEAGRAEKGKAVMDPRQREMARLRATMLTLKKMVQDNCDYVGGEFAAEARRIHYGEADERAIYGEATEDEAQELVDEGVQVGRIPWPTESDA